MLPLYMDPKSPLFKLAAQILGWGALTALSAFLTYWLGNLWLAYVFLAMFYFSGAFLFDRIMMFKFVHENTREPDEAS